MNTLAVVHSRALLGLSAPAVSVEVHLANGLPAFNIVGLPETSVRESRERVTPFGASCTARMRRSFLWIRPACTARAPCLANV